VIMRRNVLALLDAYLDRLPQPAPAEEPADA
jgi:hypothetical protein